jgi:hypothetical protein
MGIERLKRELKNDFFSSRLETTSGTKIKFSSHTARLASKESRFIFLVFCLWVFMPAIHGERIEILMSNVTTQQVRKTR